MRILEFLSDTVSFKLGLLETIAYIVICISKQVLRIQGPRGDLQNTPISKQTKIL